MISADFGRLFEVGFNIGILAYIQKEKLAHNFGDSYRRDLQQLKLPKMMAEMIREAKLLASLDAEIAEKWSLFFVQKGFLGGLNFFREYVKSTDWNLHRLEIVYCQCNFSNANSIRTYEKDEKKVFKEVLSQLTTARISLSDDEINSYIRRYSKKGEFLQADTLMLLSCFAFKLGFLSARPLAVPGILDRFKCVTAYNMGMILEFSALICLCFLRRWLPSRRISMK